LQKELSDFLSSEVLPGLEISEDQFWSSLENIINEFSPRNRELLNTREYIQEQIDTWHKSNPGKEKNLDVYKSFLKDIGYLLEEGEDFQINTQNVDPEISSIAGPQLVVPVMNARFALNAANARWGSLYDALYGTDMISEEGGASRAGAYNPVRGDKVIEFSKKFLDENFAIIDASFDDVNSFVVSDGLLQIGLTNGTRTSLKNNDQFLGFQGSAKSLQEFY
jgi:malate synthase